jgi:hypothetical protein
LTQVISSSITWTYALKRTQAELEYALMARLFAAAVLSTMLSWGLTHELEWTWGFVLGGLLFCASYAFLSVTLRTWRTSDFELFSQILSKLGPLGKYLATKIANLSSQYGIPGHAE